MRGVIRPAPALLGPAVLAAALGCLAPGAAAQPIQIRGYYLHAGAALDATPFTDGGAFGFQRLRLMASPRTAGLTFDVAYEHALELRSAAVALGRGFEGAEAAGPWLPLQGTLHEGEHARWRHAVDRLSLAAQLPGGMRLTGGRQTVSWATTLLFTPADPFSPFDPADPFREFRGGVDAVRVQLFPGPLSQIDAVVRPARTPAGTTITALGRMSGVRGGWELSGWGGTVHDEPAAAAALAGSLRGIALRAEVMARREADAGVLRAAVGVDRRGAAWGRDLYVALEYQRDGYGARTAGELLGVAASPPFQRGEMQGLARDALAAMVSYQLHPLLGADLRSIVNLRDGSLLLAPVVTYSAADEVGVRIGAFAGLGRGAEAAPPRMRSEHGATPAIGYVAVNLFF